MGGTMTHSEMIHTAEALTVLWRVVVVALACWGLLDLVARAL